MNVNEYDFSGWATRNDIKCSDGRTIRRDAFKDNDGQIVPLVWGHVHDDPTNVLGHALLVNKPEGVRAFGIFNDTDKGQHAKKAVENRDVTHLSIYANKLKQKGGDVLHGDIKEVSLVLAGANIGAFIDVPVIEHSDDDEFDAVIYSGEAIELYHADIEHDEKLEHAETEEKEEKEEKKEMAEEKKEKTLQDVVDSMTDEQKDAMYYLIGEAIESGVNTEEEENKEEKVEHSEGENEEMKYNVFDSETRKSNVLSHSDMEDIIKMAKSPQIGSFQTALEIYADENFIQHDGEEGESVLEAVGGFYQIPPTQGDLTVDALFPEYKDVRPGAPELVTSDQGWINIVMSKTHKSPISRIRTGQVDIRNIESLRAKGYQKGNKKKLTGNFKLVRRTTDPQTVYVKNALHRDDIVDITDFDYVQYLYSIDRMMLNEELATAILFGDGRDDGDADKIFPEHIRPIWTDDDLYTIHYDIDMDAAKEELQGTETDSYFGDNFVRAEAMINACLYAREDYKGSGTPDMFIHPHELNVMLLARDRNGRRIYSSKAELASAFNVGNVYTVEQMLNKTRTTDDSKTKKLLALICNLGDYQIGATKGGEITHFTQFDIDFNQEKSLLETRCSGALTRVYSAIAIEEDITA